MTLKKHILISLFLVISLAASIAQPGAPLLTHYGNRREMENQNWAICMDSNNLMLFANRRGITTFDGQSEGLIRIPTIPGSLGFCKTDKRVYVGGENDYGYLQRDEKGNYLFRSLNSDGTKVGLITRILFTDTTVYFYGEKSISRHNLKTGALSTRLLQKDNKPFTGMFNTGKSTFINVASGGLFRLESDTLFPIVTGYLLENEEVLFSLPYNDKMVLLGLGNGNLSLFDGIKFYVYSVLDDGYLKQNGLSDGITISDSLYAFSTVDGGALVVERRSGAVRKTINYLRGLPDDEIFAMGTDNNNGLWISHQYGLTRAELMLPVVNFTMYKGLAGNLINSLWHNNELYIATSEGVFYLSPVNVETNEDAILKNESLPGIPLSVAPAEFSADQLKKLPDQPAQKSRKSVFSRIIGKKPDETATRENFVLKKPDPGSVTTSRLVRADYLYVKKPISRLKSVNYVFRKAEGLNDKCKQLVSTKAGILASTNKGLYVIKDHVAKAIVTDKYIYSISNASSDNRYYVATAEGYFYVAPSGGRWLVEYPDKEFIQPLYTVVPADGNTLWAGSDDEVIRITTGAESKYRSYKMKSDSLLRLRYITNFENDTLFVFSTSGVSYYDDKSDSLKSYLNGFNKSDARLEYVISQPESPWVKQGDEWICLGSKGKVSATDRAILKIFDNIISIVNDGRNLWVIASGNQIYRVTLNSSRGIESGLGLYFRSIKAGSVKFALNDSEIKIRPGDNLVIDIVAPAYLKANSVQYQWKVARYMDGWYPWQTSTTIIPPFQYGTFTILIQARDIWGNTSDIKSLTYTRQAPFTKTRLFYLLLVTSVLFLIIFIVMFRERQLKREKHILEEKVKERTAEIEAQKEEITSSIEYASRIQHAMLPVSDHFRELFPDHFIFFKPRDIVSGDFYWIGEDENHIFFTVADCTGHGVPGAFMSTLGVSTLNEIITNKRNLHANTVLNLLREKIKTSLHQTGKEGEAADGMDLSFIILHKNRRSIEYSGAFNPLVIIQNGELKEYKGDRMPIGIYRREKESFTNFEIKVRSGDTVYLFSDGMSDQFGGPDGTKYKRSMLKKLLSDIHSKPMEEQRNIIESEFNRWKGKGEQIDDITVIGVRI
jgi:serine phosphatase RsbU (regulator of sigma subunit)